MAPTYMSGATITEVQQEDPVEVRGKQVLARSAPVPTPVLAPCPASAKTLVDWRPSWLRFETELIWFNIISIVLYHLYTVYAFAQFPYVQKRWLVLWGFFMGGVAGFGVTAGVHRYWCHKSYKANLPLRIILMLCFSVAGQNTIFDWVRDHRVHHKFSDTDADPHNSKRGFFFSHVGWLMMRKHPEVLRKGRQIDMSDVLADPVVQFSQKYFIPMKLLMCFILPTLVPVYLWGEDWYHSIVSQVCARYILSLNFTWSVNSAAHIWGYKPYDKNIKPAENVTVALVAMGEGWHNYHHVFPWDYKAAELGNYRLNVTTFWLDLFGKMGWAYDFKQPSKELVARVMARTGARAHDHDTVQEVDESEDQPFRRVKLQ